jgi:ubiquitin C-terminal hydrolase
MIFNLFDDDAPFASAHASNSGRSTAPYVGLENEGATCYLNSLLQTLYHSPPFRSWLFSLPLPELGIHTESDLVHVLTSHEEPLVEKEVEDEFYPLADEEMLQMGFAQPLIDAAKAEFRGKGERFADEMLEWMFSHANAGLMRKEQKEPKRLLVHLLELFASFHVLRGQTARVRALSTHRLTRTFGWTSADLSTQQDVAELYAVLMDAIFTLSLDVECNSAADQKDAIHDVQDRDEKPLPGSFSPHSDVQHGNQENKEASGARQLKSIMSGDMCTQTTCSVCGAVSKRSEVFWTLPLFVTNSSTPVSLESLVEEQEKEEILEGKNAYHCDTCGKVKASRKSIIARHPQILPVHLCKFAYDPKLQQRVKLYTKVTYPRLATIGGQRYELYAVVIHLGSAHGGHYKALIKTDEGKWYELNDAHVSLVEKEDDVHDSSAYMLFYRQVVVDDAPTSDNMAALNASATTTTTHVMPLRYEREWADGVKFLTKMCSAMASVDLTAAQADYFRLVRREADLADSLRLYLMAKYSLRRSFRFCPLKYLSFVLEMRKGTAVSDGEISPIENSSFRTLTTDTRLLEVLRKHSESEIRWFTPKGSHLSIDDDCEDYILVPVNHAFRIWQSLQVQLFVPQPVMRQCYIPLLCSTDFVINCMASLLASENMGDVAEPVFFYSVEPSVKVRIYDVSKKEFLSPSVLPFMFQHDPVLWAEKEGSNSIEEHSLDLSQKAVLKVKYHDRELSVSLNKFATIGDLKAQVAQELGLDDEYVEKGTHFVHQVKANEERPLGDEMLMLSEAGLSTGDCLQLRDGVAPNPNLRDLHILIGSFVSSPQSEIDDILTALSPHVRDDSGKKSFHAVHRIEVQGLDFSTLRFHDISEMLEVKQYSPNVREVWACDIYGQPCELIPQKAARNLRSFGVPDGGFVALIVDDGLPLDPHPSAVVPVTIFQAEGQYPWDITISDPESVHVQASDRVASFLESQASRKLWIVLPHVMSSSLNCVSPSSSIGTSNAAIEAETQTCEDQHTTYGPLPKADVAYRLFAPLAYYASKDFTMLQMLQQIVSHDTTLGSFMDTRDKSRNDARPVLRVVEWSSLADADQLLFLVGENASVDWLPIEENRHAPNIHVEQDMLLMRYDFTMRSWASIGRKKRKKVRVGAGEVWLLCRQTWYHDKVLGPAKKRSAASTATSDYDYVDDLARAMAESLKSLDDDDSRSQGGRRCEEKGIKIML